MPETKMKRYIVSLPVWLTEDVTAFANERGQTFSGAIREIIRVRLTREKRKKNDKNKNIPVGVK